MPELAGDEALDASLAGAVELDAAPGAPAEALGEDCAGCADCDGVAPDDAGLSVPAAEGLVPAAVSVGVCGVEGVALVPSVGVAGEDDEGAATEPDGCGFFDDEPVQSASVFKCPGR